MPKWSKVKTGDAVLLKGHRYTIEKHKVKKSGAVLVTVKGKAGTFSREMDGSAKVEIAPEDLAGIVKSMRKSDEKKLLHEKIGESGRGQTRWAKPEEVIYGKTSKAEKKKKIKAAKVVKIPSVKNAANKNVERILGGLPVATTDVHGSWVMPAVDPTTIEAHLFLYHHLSPDSPDWPKKYDSQVKAHAALHAAGDAVPFHRHEGQVP